MKTLIFQISLIFFITTYLSKAQNFHKDIASGDGDSNVYITETLNNYQIFVAFKEDGSGFSSFDIWRTDGTLDGTIKLIESNSGLNAVTLKNINNTVYFSVRKVSGTELWKTDGTVTGTVFIKSFGFASNTAINFFCNIGNTVFFVASDDAFGTELWKTDGTTAGTQIVKDISIGNISTFFIEFVNLNNYLIFKVSTNGLNQIWKSDGTNVGTINITPANSIVGSSQNMTRFNNEAYFPITFSGSNTSYLAKSDGTTSNITLLKVVSEASNFIEFNGNLYFTGYYTDGKELWKTDGTANGTVMVKDINQFGNAITTSEFPYKITKTSQFLFFVANDGINGNQLWKSDGTPNGTVIVKNINSPNDAINSDSYSDFLVVNETLYFTANDGINGLELWKSDGTAIGTHLVKDLHLTSEAPYFRRFIKLGNKLCFNAIDFQNQLNELWVSDGTESGTYMLKNAPNTPDFKGGIPVSTFGTDKLLFNAYDEVNDYEPWVTDGTGSGTIFLGNYKNAIQNSLPSHFATYKNKTYFSAIDGLNGRELWVTDGTLSGTNLLKKFSFIPQPLYHVPYSQRSKVNTIFGGIISFNDFLYIHIANNLYKYDGTNFDKVNGLPNTYLNLYDNAEFNVFRLINNKLLLFNQNLYSVNNNNIELVKSFNGFEVVYSNSMTQMRNFIYFFGNDNDSGTEVFKTDGTTSGTMAATEIGPGNQGINYDRFIFATNNFVFFSTDQGKKLWKTNGTPTGTTLVKDFGIGAIQHLYSINKAATDGNNIYFSANNGTNGYEVWKSDGTETGTVMLKDIVAGSSGSNPTYFIFFNGQIYFQADNKFWKTDGTTNGTVIVTNDITRPEDIFTYGGTLFLEGHEISGLRGFFRLNSSQNGVSRVDNNFYYMSNIYPNGDNLYFVSDGYLGGKYIGHELFKIKICTDFITLNNSNNQINQISTFLANSIISSSSKVLSSSQLEYKAGKSIILTPGFFINSGNVFNTKIEGCSY